MTALSITIPHFFCIRFRTLLYFFNYLCILRRKKIGGKKFLYKFQNIAHLLRPNLATLRERVGWRYIVKYWTEPMGLYFISVIIIGFHIFLRESICYYYLWKFRIFTQILSALFHPSAKSGTNNFFFPKTKSVSTCYWFWQG